jgi:nicotinamide riboside transporter PnuC
MKTKQNGFSVVETILVLVIVGLLGFIGWYVWHNSSAKNENASMSKPVTAKNTSDPYAGWQTTMITLISSILLIGRLVLGRISMLL